MIRRACLTGACLALAGVLAYGASPYVALWRLGAALRSGDAGFVASHVDWDSVRQGMVQQVDSQIRGLGARAKPVTTDGLAPFGASFAHGLATQVVDNAFHPDQVQAALRHLALTGGTPETHLRWAFFDAPNQFLVSVAMPCQGQMEVMQVRMQLQGDTWEVVRVVAPPELLASFSAST
jgi:Protein of unknown function (DUF2939)